MSTQTPKEVVEERDDAYGGAWAKHGQMLKVIPLELSTLLLKTPPMFFPWNMIFNKLLRILASPMNKDHWLDIQGYAQLVIDMLDKVEADEQDPKQGK